MTKANGFTLVELLAAMVAGSLLLATLGWCVATLGRELKSSARLEAGHRLDDAAPALAGLIERMLPGFAGGEAIVAEPSRLVFVTAPPAALAASGPVRIALSVRAFEGREALYARFEPADAGAPFAAAARAERRLAEGYGAIRFDYALADPGEEGVPPKLVTISFSDPAGRTVRLAAAPRFNGSANCRFDPGAMTCRR